MPGHEPGQDDLPESGQKPAAKFEFGGSAVENRESPQNAAERLASLENRAENAEAEMFATAEKKLAEAILSNDLTLDECAASEQVREAAQELAEIQQQAAMACFDTRQNINGLKARLRRLVLGGTMAVSALAGTMPPTRAAAAETRPPAAAELVETRPSFDQVRQETLTALENNTELRDAIGPENIEVIRRALERFDARRVNSIITRLAGADPARTANETPLAIHILSASEHERLSKEKRTNLADASGIQTGDEIYLMPEKFVSQDGRLTEAQVLGTLVHEQLHVAHSPGTADSNEMYETGATTTIYEGMTEMLNVRVMDELGSDQRIQAYGGGTLASAYLMERVLGTQEFARLYLDGDKDSLKEALTQRIGREGAEAIINVRMGVISRLLGEAQGIATALEIAQQGRLAGIDMSRLGDEAGANGLREKIVVSEDANMIVLSKESLTGELSQDIIFDTGVRFTPHSFPIRVSIDTRNLKQGLPAERAANRVTPRMKQTAERIETEYDQSRERTPSPEGDSFFAGRTNVYHDMFHIVLQAPPEMAGIQERYKKAATKEEKARIEEEAIQALTRTVQEAARQIQAKRLTVK